MRSLVAAHCGHARITSFRTPRLPTPHSAPILSSSRRHWTKADAVLTCPRLVPLFAGEPPCDTMRRSVALPAKPRPLRTGRSAHAGRRIGPLATICTAPTVRRTRRGRRHCSPPAIVRRRMPAHAPHPRHDRRRRTDPASIPRPARPLQQRRLLARSVLRPPAVRRLRRAGRLRRQVPQPNAAAAHRMGHAAVPRRPGAAAVDRLRRRPIRRCRGSTSTATTARPPRTTTRTAATRACSPTASTSNGTCGSPSTERFHMFTGPFQDGNDFHARRVRRRRRRVLRRARLLRRGHRHAVLRRRPGLHDRRLDRPLRAVRHADHRRPDPAVVPERRVDGGRDRRRRRHDPGPQQPVARLVELRRHVLRRLRPGHQPGLRRQQRGRQRVRRHHVHRSQGRLHRSRLRLPRRHGRLRPQLQQRRHLVHAPLSQPRVELDARDRQRRPGRPASTTARPTACCSSPRTRSSRPGRTT